MTQRFQSIPETSKTEAPCVVFNCSELTHAISGMARLLTQNSQENVNALDTVRYKIMFLINRIEAFAMPDIDRAPRRNEWREICARFSDIAPDIEMEILGEEISDRITPGSWAPLQAEWRDLSMKLIDFLSIEKTTLDQQIQNCDLVSTCSASSVREEVQLKLEPLTPRKPESKKEKTSPRQDNPLNAYRDVEHLWRTQEDQPRTSEVIRNFLQQVHALNFHRHLAFGELQRYLQEMFTFLDGNSHAHFLRSEKEAMIQILWLLQSIRTDILPSPIKKIQVRWKLRKLLQSDLSRV